MDGYVTALACGGFFCDRSAPVDQAGEDVLFAVDEARGEVTMHVQVAYAGRPRSWVRFQN